MEVLSIFSTDLWAIEILRIKLYSNKQLYIDNVAPDTVSLKDVNTNRNVYYFNYLPQDIQHELSYNFTKEDKLIIETFFNCTVYYLFYLSYRDHNSINQFISEYYILLKETNESLVNSVLINHPFDGFLSKNDFNV